MSTPLEKLQFTLVGTSPKGRLHLVHVTAHGVDDVLGYATHVRKFRSSIIFPGHILAQEDAEEAGAEENPPEIVDMTAKDFVLG